MKNPIKIVLVIFNIVLHFTCLAVAPKFNMEVFCSANRNFKLTIPGGPYVLRIGINKETLGIDRLQEIAFYKIAEKIGIAPEIIAYDTIEQIMISKYIDHVISYEQVHKPDMIKKIMRTLLILHSYQEDQFVYPTSSIFQRNDRIIASANSLNILSAQQQELIASWMATRKSFEKGYYDNMQSSICHGDLYHKNILEDKDGKIYFIDWEYASYGYPIDDLGKLCAGNDYNDEEIKFVVQNYYGNDNQKLFLKLKQNIFMHQFVMYIWCQLQAYSSPEKQERCHKLARKAEDQLNHLQEFFNNLLIDLS